MPTPAAPRFLTADITVDGDGDAGRFSGIAYSGGRIPQWNAVIDLSTTKVADEMALMLDHGRGPGGSSPIGIHREALNDGRQIRVAGELFDDIDARAADIRKKARRGAKYQMSVGLYDSNDEFITAGKTIQVNGQAYTGPLLVLRNGIVREASIVTLGADPQTHADVFSAATNPRSHAMPTLEEMEARVAALEAENADLKTRAEGAEQALADHRKTARTASVKALFEATKRELTDAAAAPYLAMSDEAFEAVSADLRALAKPAHQADAHLFQEHAPSRPAGSKSPLLADAEARGWIK